LRRAQAAQLLHRPDAANLTAVPRSNRDRGEIGLFHQEPSLNATRADYTSLSAWLVAILQPFRGALAFLFNDHFPYGPFFAFTPVFTLALEVRYFIIFPVFEKMKSWMIVGVCVLSTIFVISALRGSNADFIETASYRALFGVLPLFLVGYLLYRDVQTKPTWWARAEILGLLIGLSLFAAIKVIKPVSTQWAGGSGLHMRAVAFAVGPQAQAYQVRSSRRLSRPWHLPSASARDPADACQGEQFR
jgi:hypothetical protein